MEFPENIKAIALDLDGTLTNEEKIITPYTFEQLMLAQEKGIKLILASGRPPYGMRPLARQLHLNEHNGIILAYNGGYIEDCATGKVLYQIVLEDDLLAELHEFQSLSGMTLMTYHEDKIYTEHGDDSYVGISSRNNNMKTEEVKDFINDVPRPLNKCLLVGDPAIVPHWESRMKEHFKGRMNICHSTPYFIELLPLGIDKGDSLTALLPELGMTNDNLMSFGDSNNDFSMIECAGFGVAMGNSEQDLKDIAAYVTDDNDHDGVGKAVSKLLAALPK